jgi:hypothetical protein
VGIDLQSWGGEYSAGHPTHGAICTQESRRGRMHSLILEQKELKKKENEIENYKSETFFIRVFAL